MNEFDEMFKNVLNVLNVQDLPEVEDEIPEQPFGATPPFITEDPFVLKEFHTIKESRNSNLYNYFPLWFEDGICDIDGVYLAGGALRNLLGGDDEIADIDLFFRDEQALMQTIDILNSYDGSENGCWYKAFHCPRNELITYKSAIETYMNYDGKPTPEQLRDQKKVQLITKSFYRDVDQLLNSFDFVPTCACWYKDILYTHPDWVKSVKKRELRLHDISYPVASLSRMVKYKEKGYKLLPETLYRMVEIINTREFDGDFLALYVD